MANCVFYVLLSKNYYVLLQQTHCPDIVSSPESQNLFYEVILDYFPKIETEYPKVPITWTGLIVDEIKTQL